MNGDRSLQNDAIISIESTAEWQVHDILYDGQERYVAPLTFSDYVAKYARKIDWRKLVGSETSADDYNEDEEDDEAAGQQQTAPLTNDNELQKLSGAKDDPTDVDKISADEADDWTRGTARDQETDAGEPSQQGVGPWDSVAKRLFQSLTEMNVLLDAIQVARNGKYLVLDPVQQEAPEQPKTALMAAKKKALNSASSVLITLADQMRPKSSITASPSSQQQLEPELEELMEMRKHWRLKKVGNTIVGDLSYFSAGKYRPNATFEVKKTEKAQSNNASVSSPVSSKASIGTKNQTWRVILPKDLEETLHLRVVIEAPDGTQLGGVNYFGKKPFSKISTDGDWRDQLQLAQRTLFCRDLFAQLAREAAHVPDLCCAIRGRSVIIRLPYGHSLCVSLETYQQENEDNDHVMPSTDNICFVLEHNLQQLFDSELEGSNKVIIPRPVAAPLTHLSKKARLAGPEALSSNVLGSESDSDKLLVQRILEQTLHFLLYHRCKKTVDEFAASCQDPVVTVHWSPDTTGVWSMLRIQMLTPYYEFCGKTLLMLEISIDNVKATLRDGEVVTLSSNMQELEHFLKLRARQHIISAVGNLCRPHQWQTLFSNPCQVDKRNRLAPAILLVHPAGTSAICVRYPLVGDPEILIQTTSDASTRVTDETRESNDDSVSDKHQLWACLRNTQKKVNYDQLPGNNFLHKIELLCATLT